jgi:hypothetical protein
MDYNKQLKAVDAKISMELLASQVKELDDRMDSYRKVLETNCQHENTTKVEKYYDGGYDYVSSVRITVTCDLCNKILESYDDPKHRGYFA